jgi:adenine-specific DNA-methyltransferase
MTREEREDPERIPGGSRIFRADKLTSSHPPGSFAVEFEGRSWTPTKGYWSTSETGMNNLKAAGRLIAVGDTLSYVRFIDDFPVFPIGTQWTDTVTSGFTSDKLYAVQTNAKVIQRCLLMCTDPGDLVLDPTCGSGTTAYVAEQWGRRWITIDTSRVPLALTRQRLLTATFSYYEIKEELRGPAGGFVYKRKQNRKGAEVGGIVPHVTLKSVANNEPPQDEVLVDRPETVDRIVRVAGPFTVEATIPTPVDLDGDGEEDSGTEPTAYASYLERMLEVLRKSPVLQLGSGKAVTLRNIRPPTKSLALSAEAVVDANGRGEATALRTAVDAAHEINTGGFRFSQKPIAIVFGPESGAVSEKLVFEAAREANAKNFTHIYVIGFAIQANARTLVESSEATVGIPATYVQATPDLMMGDLLKTTRASQIFSVCGMPDIILRKLRQEKDEDAQRYQVELLGYDVFDPTTMEIDHPKGSDVPVWMLDTDYNSLVFHGTQVFFPRTSAWDSLKKALKTTHDETVWDHLAGTVSTPFEAGEHDQIAV